MFLYDLKDRFMETQFEGKTELSDPLFFIHCLEENFKWWNLVFYVTVLGGLLLLLSRRLHLRSDRSAWLIPLSVGCWAMLGVFLSAATTTKYWYFTPAMPFVAITTVYGIEWLSKRFRPALLLFFFFWIFTIWFRYLGPKPVASPGSDAPDFYSLRSSMITTTGWQLLRGSSLSGRCRPSVCCWVCIFPILR